MIIGGSFAGIKCAWEVRRRIGDEHKIILLSNKPKTIFRASFPHVLFEDQPLEGLTLHLALNFANTGIEFIEDSLVEVNQDNNAVVGQKTTYSYDYLILATGARHAFELLPGSSEYAESICDPTLVLKTKEALINFKGGIFYTGVGGDYTPCDGPPFEVIMNLDYRLRELGFRDKAELHFITDKPHLLPPGGPKIWARLEKLFHDHDIQFHLNTHLEKLDKKQLYFSDGTAKPYDLCALIVPYRGIKALDNSKLIDERGFVPVSVQTFRATQSTHYNIYAVGDCVALPGPKQGHLALMQATIAAEHIAWRINQKGNVRAYLPEFKCVIDLGGKRGLFLYSQWMSDGDVVTIAEGRKPYESKVKFEKLFFEKHGDIGELHHEMMK